MGTITGDDVLLWDIPSPLEYYTLSNDAHAVIYNILRKEIPKEEVKHICDGMPKELINRSGYPFVIVKPPRIKEVANRLDLDKRRAVLRFYIDIHTRGDRADKQLRKIVGYVRKAFHDNLQTMRTYGLKKFVIEDVNHREPEIVKPLIYYSTRIIMYMEWGT